MILCKYNYVMESCLANVRVTMVIMHIDAGWSYILAEKQNSKMKIICFSCKNTWRTDTSTREDLTSCWGCLVTYLEFHGNEHISWSVKNSGEYSQGARTKHVCDGIQYFWSHLLPILFLLLLLLLLFFFFFFFFFFFWGGGGDVEWLRGWGEGMMKR